MAGVNRQKRWELFVEYLVCERKLAHRLGVVKDMNFIGFLYQFCNFFLSKTVTNSMTERVQVRRLKQKCENSELWFILQLCGKYRRYPQPHYIVVHCHLRRFSTFQIFTNEISSESFSNRPKFNIYKQDLSASSGNVANRRIHFSECHCLPCCVPFSISQSQMGLVICMQFDNKVVFNKRKKN